MGARRPRAGTRRPTTRCGPSWPTWSPPHLGRSFRPSVVRFTTALPKTRSAKVVRRAIRAAVTGDDPGDLSSIEDPGALDAVRAAS